jgi:hypothetical protein
MEYFWMGFYGGLGVSAAGFVVGLASLSLVFLAGIVAVIFEGGRK